MSFPQDGSPPEATSSYHMATWWGSLLATSLDTFQGTWVLQGTYGEGSPATEHPHFCWPQYRARGGDCTLRPCILPPSSPAPQKKGWGLFGPVARPTHAIIADCLAVAMEMASTQKCGAT